LPTLRLLYRICYPGSMEGPLDLSLAIVGSAPTPVIRMLFSTARKQT